MLSRLSRDFRRHKGEGGYGRVWYGPTHPFEQHCIDIADGGHEVCYYEEDGYADMAITEGGISKA